MGEWLKMECLKNLHICLNILRKIHVLHIIMERISWPLRIFYLNRFYSDLLGRFLNFVFTKVNTIIRTRLGVCSRMKPIILLFEDYEYS